MTLEIGLAGTGKMGSAMAHRLLAQGFTVTVWNRTRERCLPLQEAGARIASSPAELSASCDVVISSLTNEEALKTVYQQPGGLLEGTPKCGLFIEMSVPSGRPRKSNWRARYGPQERASSNVRWAAPWGLPGRAGCWGWWEARRTTWSAPGRCWSSCAAAWSMWARWDMAQR